MNNRLLEAYLDYSGDLARAGIINDALTENVEDDRPLDERIIDILRAAGRLPEGWDQEGSRRGWRLTTVKGEYWQALAVPLGTTVSSIKNRDIDQRHVQLRRTSLAAAS